VKNPSNWILRLFVCLVMVMPAVLGGGCAGTGGTRYSGLEPLPQPEGTPVVTQGKRLVVAVGPVDVPGYITHAAAVVNATIGGANISEADARASTLEWEIPRVVAENVRRLLAPNGIEVIRDSRGRNADYRIEIDLVTFQATRFDTLDTQADWIFYGRDGRALMTKRNVSFSTPIAGKTEADTRSAMSRALADLARGIVKDIRGVLGTR